jgi:hypothetical protein
MIDVPVGTTTAALHGTLLTVDILREEGRLSYDLTAYLPNGLWVEDESPYGLLQVLGTDGVTLELVVRDNSNVVVDSFRPAG